MFSKLVAVSVLAVLAVATPTPGGGSSGGSVNQCNTGTIQCCNQVTSASSENEWGGLLSLLDLGGDTIPVGLQCSPVLGLLGGNSCNSNAFCCENNQVSGLIALGCTQINL